MKNNFIVTAVATSLLLFSCNSKDENKGAPVAQPYKVIEITKSNTILQVEYPAKLEGIADVEIRAKVDGYIEKIYVDEGQEVKKGQILFKLETQTATQEAAAARAKVDLAQVEVNRLKPLVERKIISDVQLASANANLANARSMYQGVQAKINYATITSPVNGIVGSLSFRVGSYVSSQTQEPLTRISDINTVYAYFSINEKEQLSIMMESEGKTFQDKIENMPAVKLLLSNGMEYEQKGKIETFSGQANAQTGSFNVRASFPNPARILRSGASGVVQIPTNLKDIILIPQSATVELQDKRIVLIVEKDNKLKAVPVVVRPVPGGQYFVVDSGLEINDKLLIEGVGIVTEGTEIKPEIVPFSTEKISVKK